MSDNKLRVANVRMCLDILKQFYEDTGNEKLKKMAGKALDHLDKIFAPEPGDVDANGCPPNVQSF